MNKKIRRPFDVCFVASLFMMAVALHLWGAQEIRENAVEVILLTGIGAVWLMFAVKSFSWLGLNFQIDVVELKNIAALVALCGAVVAVALIYTGGSLGEGPFYWNNYFSTALGMGGFFALWVLLELAANNSMSIAEERDLASGIRLCGFLIAIGLVYGRAEAGDWHSAVATIHDFVRDGWPAIVLWLLAVSIERLTRPSRRHPFPPWQSHGLSPALLYVALAVGWVCHLGAWEGMQR